MRRCDDRGLSCNVTKTVRWTLSSKLFFMKWTMSVFFLPYQYSYFCLPFLVHEVAYSFEKNCLEKNCQNILVHCAVFWQFWWAKNFLLSRCRKTETLVCMLPGADGSWWAGLRGWTSTGAVYCSSAGSRDLPFAHHCWTWCIVQVQVSVNFWVQHFCGSVLYRNASMHADAGDLQ